MALNRFACSYLYDFCKSKKKNCTFKFMTEICAEKENIAFNSPRRDTALFLQSMNKLKNRFITCFMFSVKQLSARKTYTCNICLVLLLNFWKENLKEFAVGHK